MIKILTLSGTLLLAAGAAWAEGEALWRASDITSATLVPSYAGQPSPFPLVVVQAPVSEGAISSTEELERMQQREEVLRRANALLESPQAVTPFINGIQVGGQIEGLLGPRVLLGNNWVGAGQKLAVRVTLSSKVQAMVDELSAYDRDMANDMSAKFKARVAQHPTTPMTVKSITPDTLTLTSSLYGAFKVPVSKRD